MISVIVPVYKAEKYLERCVNSILNQTYKDIELILVDDGSPDRCPEICDEFVKKDSRVVVFHKVNGGVSTARNLGLEKAKGDYISFIDSDDYIDLDMYEKMMAEAIKHDCDVIMCDCVKEFPDHKELYSHNIRDGFYNKEELKKEYFSHLLIMENVEYPATISNVTLLWKKCYNTSDMRYEAGVRFSEDLLFGAKLMRRANSFFYMKNKAFYHYVMNPSSASHTFVPDKWNDYSLLHSRIKAEFANDKEFDFSKQIDKCLLFFIYNTVGEIFGADLDKKEKLNKINEVLKSKNTLETFKNIKINKLPISNKLKIMTFMYKYRIGLPLLINYFGRK